MTPPEPIDSIALRGGFFHARRGSNVGFSCRWGFPMNTGFWAAGHRPTLIADVADENLFTLAEREIEKTLATGKPVFAQVMTTSNHRPYTYPDGRIDIPSHTSRAGAVKYTDYAIGKFIKACELVRVLFANPSRLFGSDAGRTLVFEKSFTPAVPGAVLPNAPSVAEA